MSTYEAAITIFLYTSMVLLGALIVLENFIASRGDK